MNWDKGFKSPFKSDVYFFTLREQTGLKWGTPQPITVRDKEFGAIRMRAFGTYSFRIEDVAPFGTKMMGSLDRLTHRRSRPAAARGDHHRDRDRRSAAATSPSSTSPPTRRRCRRS